MSDFIIPLFILFIVVYAFFNKVDIYNVFIDGAKEGIKIIINIFPSLLAMILAINIFINSGIILSFIKILNPLLLYFKIPGDIVPMAIMRSMSGSASLAMLNNIFLKNGPDSLVGRICSVIQGSTDTTLYIISLYFGYIGIKKTRQSLFVGLMADFISVIVSIIIIKLFFG